MSFSDKFCDLNGDGKVTPEEEFTTYMILEQESKGSGSSGGGSGGSGKRGPLVFFIFLFAFAVLITIISNCFDAVCSGYYYSKHSANNRNYYTPSYKSTGRNNTSNNTTVTNKSDNSTTNADIEKRISEGIPFVGMSEKYINDTSLGEARLRGHNNEMKNGEVLKANLYGYYRDGKLIFSIRCLEGTVVQVWDHRDNGSSDTRSSNKRNTKSPKYDVDDFAHAEDFYDWYKDDFMDYEEAEEYYEEHGGY